MAFVQLFRIAKNIEHLRAAAIAYDSAGGDHVLKYTAVLRQLGYAGYLTLDTGTYLDTIGAVQLSNPKATQEAAYKYWAFGIASSIVSGVYSFYQLHAKSTSINPSEGAEKSIEQKQLHKQKVEVVYQLVSDLLDLTIPIAGIKYVEIDDGIVGLAGFTSSLLGIYAQWLKTA